MNEQAINNLITRIVNLEEHIADLRGEVKELYNEAKEGGHLKGALRLVVKRMLESAEKRQAREAIEAEAMQIAPDLFAHADRADELAERRRGRGRPRRMPADELKQAAE
jgi:uncharacterized protein (UPF0335 family)